MVLADSTMLPLEFMKKHQILQGSHSQIMFKVTNITNLGTGMNGEKLSDRSFADELVLITDNQYQYKQSL